MVDLVTAAAIGLLAVGVVGSVVPGLPGAGLSLAGVLLYAGANGFADPSVPVLAAFVAVGAFAVVVDYVGGPLAAGIGGASRQSVVLAAIVGVVLLFVTGPVGALVGLAVTVFGLEFRRVGDVRASGRAAGYAVVGVLGSALVQLLLTGAIFVAFLLVVVW